MQLSQIKTELQKLIQEELHRLNKIITKFAIRISQPVSNRFQKFPIGERKPIELSLTSLNIKGQL